MTSNDNTKYMRLYSSHDDASCYNLILVSKVVKDCRGLPEYLAGYTVGQRQCARTTDQFNTGDLIEYTGRFFDKNPKPGQGNALVLLCLFLKWQEC